MEQQKRHKGFVVGSRLPRGRTDPVWTVRIKDSESEFNGQKLIVLSTRNGLSLGRGLNVNFIVGNVDNASNEKERRAVDVSPE